MLNLETGKNASKIVKCLWSDHWTIVPLDHWFCRKIGFKSHFRWHFRSQLFHRSSSSWFKIKHFLTKLSTLDCIDLKRRLAYPYFGQGIENFQTLNSRLLYIVPNHFLHPKWKHELTCIYLGSSKRPWRCSLTSQFLT